MKTLLYILKQHRNIKFLLVALLFFNIISCDDFLEVEEPFGQISDDAVFENEALAVAAMTTIYSKLREDVLLTGTFSGMSVLMGTYADELDYYGNPGNPLDNFYQHNVLPSNNTLTSLWNNSYNIIYRVNAVLEGVQGSSSISQSSKNQLRGEGLFIRGLAHFYLVNVFGDIPYIQTTDYRINNQVRRTEEETIYNLIIQDLTEAKSLISSNYITVERTRPNTGAVSALLARVYLYHEDWDLAVQESTSVINNTTLYDLENNLQEEFLKESTSTIWHFKPKFQGFNTNEASTFIFNSGPPPTLALSYDLFNSMEMQDLRKVHWVREVNNGTNSWYHSNKYQSNQNTGVSVEYSVVLRLSEQYLIRSEASARLGDFTSALDDLNTIRNRAGLNDVNTTSLNDYLLLLLNERRHELFTEHGHRWFDLKRMGYAQEVLAPIKTGWSINNLYLPIPESELLINPNLNPQNPGY